MNLTKFLILLGTRSQLKECMKQFRQSHLQSHIFITAKKLKNGTLPVIGEHGSNRTIGIALKSIKTRF